MMKIFRYFSCAEFFAKNRIFAGEARHMTMAEFDKQMEARMKGPCQINVKLMPNLEHSLIIKPANHTEFMEPDENGDIFFKYGESVFLSCAKGNQFKRFPFMAANFMCHRESTFEYELSFYDFYSDLDCQETPKYDIIDRELTYSDYEDARNGLEMLTFYHEYYIGFFVDNADSFLNVLQVYVDDGARTTSYVKSRISKFLAGGQNISLEPRKFNTTFCGSNEMDNIYEYTSQESSFTVQLHGQKNYLQPKSGYVFNRGQLTAKSSLVYSAAATTTYTYLNVAPQWANIKDGNWAKIETHVNEIAKVLKKDLTVITGGFGVLQLNDTADEKQYMRLDAKSRGSMASVPKFPIPLFSFKIAIEPEKQEGVVFVTVNNPYITNGTEYEICTYPLIKVPGVKMPVGWEPGKADKGYSYMCTVGDFFEQTKYALADDNQDIKEVCDLLYIPEPDLESESVKVQMLSTTTAPKYVRFFNDEIRK